MQMSQMMTGLDIQECSLEMEIVLKEPGEYLIQ